MPRRLLRDGRVVADDWTYLGELGNDTPGLGAPSSGTGLILTFDQWLADKPKWLEGTTRLGVVLSPAHKVEQLAPDLARFQLVGADFPGPSEGRGYTQGRLLRERYQWQGELRATGYVRRDQLFFLARCGFNSFELPDSEIDSAAGAFSTFSAEYQPSNDAGLALKLQRR
ncbi:MAG: DUF934 domain-containing protein [Pseudomonadota bacterium]|nr:DUF934 domain-containing protein [Pseudomonadota bacterium]